MVRKILGVSTRDRIPNIQHQEWSMLECCTTSFTMQMEMGRTCCKASPHQMGAGNNYVGPLPRQDNQR
jgi:hypothetical protein